MTNESKYHKINFCRVCKNENLILVLDLGEQFLSGIFPKFKDTNIDKGPLRLVKCNESNGGCGLVQLEHTYDLPSMYGDQYGYRSGLNASMIEHLKSKHDLIMHNFQLKSDDIVIDIAGNDGTFLSNFDKKFRLCSIDPTSKKFSKYFPDHIDFIPNFFSEEIFNLRFPGQKAMLITSFSMFYDLEDPIKFANDVKAILDPINGIWVLEQSYMPEMVKMNSFDTICHEHLSYYGMKQLKYIMDASGFKILDFEFNGVNGGSISLTVSNEISKYSECTEKLDSLLQKEKEMGFSGLEPWENFSANIEKCRVGLWEILNTYRDKGFSICALGASTKGNVTLQTWKIGPEVIKVIADVNSEKHGHVTPGTWIPIEDEESVIKSNFDLFLVLPWHFRDFFLNNPKFKGKKLLFPLPAPEIVVPL